MVHTAHKTTVAALLGGICVVLLLSDAGGEGRRRPARAPDPMDAPPRPTNKTQCNYQDPLPFLVRKNFVLRGKLTKAERQERHKLHQKSIRYRTEQYGFFKGFGKRAWNAKTPQQNAMWTTFMGLKVRLNKRITPALACVEQQIKTECSSTPYTPKRLSGLRTKNTFHNGEVSNHVYGIGIDVDPTLNTCCGCVAQWADHPLCKRPAKSIYERMAMPSCWVHVFERFGFYWLGHDRLQDTMHFEFIGDPAKISRAAAASPPPPNPPTKTPAKAQPAKTPQ